MLLHSISPSPEEVQYIHLTKKIHHVLLEVKRMGAVRYVGGWAGAQYNDMPARICARAPSIRPFLARF